MGDRLLLGACSGFRTGESGKLRLTAVSAAYGGRAARGFDAIAFSADGSRLRHAGSGRVVEIETANGQELSSRVYAGELYGLAADGRTVIAVDKEHVVVDAAGVAGPRLEGIGAGSDVGLDGRPIDRRWRPNAVQLAGGVIWGVSQDMHKRLFAWDAGDGRALLATKERHQNAIVLPSTDGRSALLVSEVRQEWTVLSRFSLADPEPREIARFTFFDAAYVARECAADLPLTTVVLEQGHAVVVVDAASGTVLRRIALPGTVVALAASDDLRVVACLVDLIVRKRLEVWDARDGRLVAAEDQPAGEVWGSPLRVSPEGSSIAFTRGVDRDSRDELVVWDVVRWMPRTWPDLAPRLGRVATLGAREASLTAVGTRTAVYDPLTLDEITGPPEEPIAVPTVNLRMGQWRTGSSERHRVTPSPEKVLAFCADPPRAITVLPCAVLVVEIHESDSGRVDTASEIYLWDLASTDAAPRLVERVEGFRVTAAAFSPDGKWMGWQSRRGRINLCNVETLEILESLPMPSSILEEMNEGKIPTLTFAMAAGRRHWAVAASALVMLRHAGIAEPIDVVDLSSADDQVTSLAFSPSGDALYAGTRRGAVLRFEITEDR